MVRGCVNSFCFALVALFSVLLIAQDCPAQSNPCDSDPCQGIPNAVAGTCSYVGGPCTGVSDYMCTCVSEYTWHGGTRTCQSPPPTSPIWCFETGGTIEGSPAIANDGTVYAGSTDHYLYAINPDGTEKWSFDTGWYCSSPAIANDGTVYVGVQLQAGSLYAINPDGTEKWRFPTLGGVASPPAIANDGTVYAGSWNGYLYAINPDGTEKWRLPVGSPVRSSPAIANDGTVYVAMSSRRVLRDGSLCAINPDGTEKWRFPVASYYESSPAIGCDGTVYVGSWNGYLYAINSDGTEKWRSPIGSHVRSSPAIANDSTVYVVGLFYELLGYDSYLYAINSDGTEKWRFPTGHRFYNDHSSPTIANDGTVYVGSLDGYLYAINSDGTEKWGFLAGDDITTSPALATDGTVYVASSSRTVLGDGSLCAIDGGSGGLADTPWPMFHHDIKHTGLAGLVEPPLSPIDVTATAGNGQVAINWDDVPEATSYNIYWSTSSGVTTSDTQIGGVTSPYYHYVANETTYYYVVTAENICGVESGVSSEVSATPSAGPPPVSPTNVAATAGDEEVTVSWDPVSGATYYSIYWSTSPGVTTSDTKITGVANPYTHTGLTNGTTYYYVVTAENGYSESSVSSEVDATPEASSTPPLPPTNVAATAGDEEVTVSWDPVSGATSYNVYWSTSPGVTTSDTKITGVANPYTHTGLTNGTTYYYVVTAKNSYGESSVSSEVDAAPFALWAKTYGKTYQDWPHSIQQTSDNGYIVSGQTRSFGAGNDDIWVLKLDPDGTVAWERTYGETGDDRGYSILQTPDGGYIVAGLNGGRTDIWVLKLNSDGTVAWQKAYESIYSGGGLPPGTPLSSAANSIQQTSDGGYIVGGYIDLFTVGGKDFLVLKLTSDGSVAWQKSYGEIATEGVGVESIQQTSDGGYIVLGNTVSFGSGSYDMWLLKLTSTGGITWQKTYGGTDYDWADSVEHTLDGGYIVAGFTDSFGAGNDDAWVLKLTSDGAVTWQKTYGGTDYDQATFIRQTSDSGYIVTGNTSSFGAGSNDAWVLKLTSDGAVTWQKSYGGTANDLGYSLQETTDGGYALAAYTNSFGAGGSDFWVLKLDSDGTLGCGLDSNTSAVVGNTTVTGLNTTVTGTDYSPTITNTTVTGQSSAATISTQCP